MLGLIRVTLASSLKLECFHFFDEKIKESLARQEIIIKILPLGESLHLQSDFKSD